MDEDKLNMKLENF